MAEVLGFTPIPTSLPMGMAAQDCTNQFLFSIDGTILQLLWCIIMLVIWTIQKELILHLAFMI